MASAALVIALSQVSSSQGSGAAERRDPGLTGSSAKVAPVQTGPVEAKTGTPGRTAQLAARVGGASDLRMVMEREATKTVALEDARSSTDVEDVVAQSAQVSEQSSIAPRSVTTRGRPVSEWEVGNGHAWENRAEGMASRGGATGSVTSKQDLGTSRSETCRPTCEGGDADASLVRLPMLGLHGSTSVQVTRRGCARGPECRNAVRTATNCADARRGLAYYRAAYAGWREKMGRDGATAIDHASSGESQSADERSSLPCSRFRYLASRWREKARAARHAYEFWFARTYEKWRCIHEHEGAWNDSDPPYWGGLQMTSWFQQSYGSEFYRRWGTADRWPVFAQLIAAERAWRECSCFRQWGTAGACGLR